MRARVQVIGLRETDRAFRKIDADLGKRFRDKLKEAAEPVAETARSKLSRYMGASVSTIRPAATAKFVAVRQSKNKVTGKRGDFGVLQMQKVLEPALDEHEGQVTNDIEEAINEFARENSF